MNDEEKIILINLLLDEYNKTHEHKLIEIVDKVRNCNHIFKIMTYNNCVIENNSEKYNFCNVILENLEIINNKIKITDNKIKIGV